MRLCANENLPADCVIKLRADSHDVLWIREAAPGSPDSDVLTRAQKEDRLLITFDKDFGELVFKAGAKASRGIVLFRIPQPSSDVVAVKVSAVLASRNDWSGQFSVVEEFAVRMSRCRMGDAIHRVGTNSTRPCVHARQHSIQNRQNPARAFPSIM